MGDVIINNEGYVSCVAWGILTILESGDDLKEPGNLTAFLWINKMRRITLKTESNYTWCK